MTAKNFILKGELNEIKKIKKILIMLDGWKIVMKLMQTINQIRTIIRILKIKILLLNNMNLKVTTPKIVRMY